MGRLYILTEERMQENGRKLASKVGSRVEELLGIVSPIIQAPFGGFASQRLTAAVSNLGGLGSLGVVSLSESAIRDAVVEMLSLTNKAIRGESVGVNLRSAIDIH
jgi:NAD(P)H-dependent flavin oxidoreductase YrpB (nitropropane dioxygenase family)